VQEKEKNKWKQHNELQFLEKNLHQYFWWRFFFDYDYGDYHKVEIKYSANIIIAVP
jgi:hypothetical protein